MDRYRSSHKYLRTEGRGRLRGVSHHLSLLRGKGLFEHRRSPGSAFQQTTNFEPPRAVFGIVIFITDKTRILWFALVTFLERRFRGVLFRLIWLILRFPFLLSFRGFVCRGGLDDIDLRSNIRSGCYLRSVFIRSI